jgi:hypothetical protein
MFARVLFPTDFSSYADSVLACLPDLMSAGLREVILLSVIRSSDVPMPETVNRDSLEYWRWSLYEKLNIAKMALEGKGLRMLSTSSTPLPFCTLLAVPGTGLPAPAARSRPGHD